MVVVRAIAALCASDSERVIMPVSGIPPTLFASTAPERYRASKPMDSMSWADSALMAPGMETQPESRSARNFAERSADETKVKSFKQGEIG
jgi:hypothetical protein